MKSLNIIRKIARLSVAIPFGACMGFLIVLGKCLRLRYEQISVYFNLYLQGGLLTLSGLMPLVASTIRYIHHATWMNGLLLLALLGYATIYLAGFSWLIRHYSGNATCTFDKCVAELHELSRHWHLSYRMVNLVIFVVWWASLVAANVTLCLLLL